MKIVIDTSADGTSVCIGDYTDKRGIYHRVAKSYRHFAKADRDTFESVLQDVREGINKAIIQL